MEISFMLIYLLFIWFMIIKMIINRKIVDKTAKPIALRLFYGFLLLAIGDTGHVGFRVFSYLNGGLDVNIALLGIGSLSTAITIGFLYMIIVDIWRIRYNKAKGAVYVSLIAIGIIRLIIMCFPGNEWLLGTKPEIWQVSRNIPLTIQGIWIAILILKDAKSNNDKIFLQFAYCILASYIFYIPAIYFSRYVPMLGMLMIPKTIAYMIMAWIAYKNYFTESKGEDNT